MIGMQKRKFMQEFTFDTSVECLSSNLLTKFLMHNCVRAEHAKTCQCSIHWII